MRSSGRLAVRFAVLFLAQVILFFAIAETAVVQRLVHEPLARFVGRLVAVLLGAFGSVALDGFHLTFNGFRAEIAEACNGVLPTYVFAAAVFAFPSRWRDKGLGLLIGIPAIFVVNIARVVTLMYLGAYWPELFERVHIYVWQAFVVALSLAVWVFWAERFARPRATLRA